MAETMMERTWFRLIADDFEDGIGDLVAKNTDGTLVLRVRKAWNFGGPDLEQWEGRLVLAPAAPPHPISSGFRHVLSDEEVEARITPDPADAVLSTEEK